MASIKETDTVVIKNDKVYSSYYARACKIIPDSRLVAISVTVPDGFKGSQYKELNPHSSLLYEYKNGLCTWDDYVDRYKKGTLSLLDPYEVYNKLKGKVILCYCAKTKCHRYIVIDWLRENIGEEAVGDEL